MALLARDFRSGFPVPVRARRSECSLTMSNVRGFERLKFESKKTEGTVSRGSGSSSRLRNGRRRGDGESGIVSSSELVLKFDVEIFARSFESTRSVNEEAGTTEVSFDPMRMCSSSRPCLNCRCRS